MYSQFYTECMPKFVDHPRAHIWPWEKKCSINISFDMPLPLPDKNFFLIDQNVEVALNLKTPKKIICYTNCRSWK